MPHSLSRQSRRAPGRPPANVRAEQHSILPVAGVFQDWRAILSENDLNHETTERLATWSDYLERGGPPPDPLPLDASEEHILQALRSFMRNTWREARLQNDGRIHDLRQTVADLVEITTAQARTISNVRDEVHQLLHGVEDAYPDSESVSASVSAVRRQLRDLDSEAKKARAALNERLQELRTSLLPQGSAMPEIVETDSEREIYFRTLCAAANLFGENVAVVHFDFAQDTMACRQSATILRGIFRRKTDVVCRVSDELSVIVIDTPAKQVMRLAANSLSQIAESGFAVSAVYTATGVETAGRFGEALAEAGEFQAGDITQS